MHVASIGAFRSRYIQGGAFVNLFWLAFLTKRRIFVNRRMLTDKEQNSYKWLTRVLKRRIIVDRLTIILPFSIEKLLFEASVC